MSSGVIPGPAVAVFLVSFSPESYRALRYPDDRGRIPHLQLPQPCFKRTFHLLFDPLLTTLTILPSGNKKTALRQRC